MKSRQIVGITLVAAILLVGFLGAVPAEAARSGYVKVTVVTPVNGRLRPVAYATVTITLYNPTTPGGASVTGVTDGKGMVSFSSSLLKPGLYQAHAEKAGVGVGDSSMFGIVDSMTTVKITVVIS